jgi:hypothetical protein
MAIEASQGPTIFKRRRNGVDEFWRGRASETGRLLASVHRCDAFVFKTRDAALQCAETHDELRNSEEWKVAPR